MKTRGLAAVVLLVSGCGYNRIQTMDEQVNAAQSQIEVQLQRRADLIPNLVETVRGVAGQEQAVFGDIAAARARLAGAVQSRDVGQMAQANQEVTGALSRLLVVVENYPQLRSNENFRALQDQLEGTENRISTSRQDYNEAVRAYNSYIRRFPVVITAKVIGKGARPYFEVTNAAAREAPRVEFNRPGAPNAAPADSARATPRP
jgi:LemA protein